MAAEPHRSIRVFLPSKSKHPSVGPNLGHHRSNHECLTDADVSIALPVLRGPGPRRSISSIDSNAFIAYIVSMSTTLTIRNLKEDVKQLLRVRAATNGRAMEAEARDILTKAVMGGDHSPQPPELARRPSNSVCDAVRGSWRGRRSTDEILELTRGDS